MSKSCPTHHPPRLSSSTVGTSPKREEVLPIERKTNPLIISDLIHQFLELILQQPSPDRPLGLRIRGARVWPLKGDADGVVAIGELGLALEVVLGAIEGDVIATFGIDLVDEFLIS